MNNLIYKLYSINIVLKEEHSEEVEMKKLICFASSCHSILKPSCYKQSLCISLLRHRAKKQTHDGDYEESRDRHNGTV